MKPIELFAFVLSAAFGFWVSRAPVVPEAAVVPRVLDLTPFPVPESSVSPERDFEPSEFAQTDRFLRAEEQLLGARTPWDEHAPAFATPARVTSLLDAFYDDGLDVLDLDCTGNPCVAVVEYPANFDFRSELSDELDAVTDEAYMPFIGGGYDPDAGDSELKILALSIHGADVQGDPGIMSRMLASMFAVEHVVPADSEETHQPFYTGTGWPD